MQSLFSPVPFGNAPVKSVMQQAAEPEVYAIWESFISIDMDKQSRVLKVSSIDCGGSSSTRLLITRLSCLSALCIG